MSFFSAIFVIGGFNERSTVSGGVTARFGTRRPTIGGLVAGCIGTLLLLVGETGNTLLLLVEGEITVYVIVVSLESKPEHHQDFIIW